MLQRRTLIVLSVAAAVLLATVVVAVAAEDEDPSAPERALVFRVVADDGPELVVYLPSEVDTPQIAPDSAQGLRLMCADAAGKPLVRARQPWPVGSAGFVLAHFHHPVVDEPTLRRIARCELTGTAQPLNADLIGHRILRKHPHEQPLDPAAEGLGQ